MVGALLLTEAITYSPPGTALYKAVTAGSPGAAVPALDFAPPPAGPRVTGRTLSGSGVSSIGDFRKEQR